MIWFDIKNEHGREMKVNKITTKQYSADNELGKIVKVIFNGEKPDCFDTEDLIGKKVGIVLRKKIKRSKSFLNIVNFIPLKSTEKEAKESIEKDNTDISKIIAELLETKPEILKAALTQLKREKSGRKARKPNHDVKKLSDFTNKPNDLIGEGE